LSLGLSTPAFGARRAAQHLARLPAAGRDRLPGIVLCLLVACGAVGLQALERATFGRSWLESLVLAILLGAAIRTAWTPGARWRAGIDFCARPVLEVAVVLLGLSVSATTLLSAGWALPLAVAGTVCVSLLTAFGIGRALGLNRRMAILIACGNSICGNSAIAAVAPLIGADADDVTASIAFTAVLGVLTVLVLPLAGAALHLSPTGLGALAGLTVYAVPQVLAATAAMGPTAMQFGALVKLTRVLMLGPVFAVLALILGRRASSASARAWPPVHKLLPWFIVGFLVCLAARSAGVVPTPVIAPAETVTGLLTTLSMAGLGLMTDLRALRRAGGRAAVAATLSLSVLAVIALGVVRLLGLA
jgi:uncharacterized integral membrane protein (TIGR00698 family)